MRRRPFLNVLIAAGAAAACSDAPGPGEIATHLAFQTQPAASFPLLPIVGPVRVAVLDEQNRVVTGASHMITVGVGANPSGAALVGVETAPAVGGVATFSNIALTAAGSGFTLVATASGLTGAASTLFDVMSVTPASIAFQTQPAGSIRDSVIKPGPIRVALLAANGDVLTPGFGTVSIAIGANPGGAMLSGTSSVETENGVATFSDLKLSAVGTGYTLVATFGELPPVTSSPFNVTLSVADVDGDGFSPSSGDCDDRDPAVRPGAVDRPDARHVDANCDGFDGEPEQGIFVARENATPPGADAATCGPRQAPCRTIQFALGRAAVEARSDVYAMVGEYAGPVTLVNGIGIYGGYDDSWRHADPAIATTTIVGANSVDVGGSEPQAVTIYAANLSVATVLSDVTIRGPAATGVTATGHGRSSYAVLMRNVPAGVLTLRHLKIFGGVGSDAGMGTNGVDAPQEPAMAGGAGGDGATGSSCDATSRGAAGLPGTNPLVTGAISATGGAGGRGGTMDTSCDPLNLTPTAGEKGEDAVTSRRFSTDGVGGDPGLGSDGPCQSGSPPNSSSITVGQQGAPITSVGQLIGEFWHGLDGTEGGRGGDGAGGGGGGGAGGCGNAFGAGGGGGGAGGLGGSGGGGGRGAGGSFGIYLIGASPVFDDVRIERGRGGIGGKGGRGGKWQPGGVGGRGGVGPGGATGGDGGYGAYGGTGAGGTGGAGGNVVGVFRTSTASNPGLSGVVVTLGLPGEGGEGGAAAVEFNGLSLRGRVGASGQIITIGLCATPTHC